LLREDLNINLEASAKERRNTRLHCECINTVAELKDGCCDIAGSRAYTPPTHTRTHTHVRYVLLIFIVQLLGYTFMLALTVVSELDYH